MEAFLVLAFIFCCLVEGAIELFKEVVAGGSLFQWVLGGGNGFEVELIKKTGQANTEEGFEIVEKDEKLEKKVTVELSEEEWKNVQGTRLMKGKEEVSPFSFPFAVMVGSAIIFVVLKATEHQVKFSS